MRRKTIFLIRHGETDYNRRSVVQGSGIDAELNEMGKAQADAFYDAYGHVPFDKIYTSALVRTQQSVARFIQSGIPHQPMAGLNEISWGIYEGTAHTFGEDNAYKSILHDWKEGRVNQALEGGESPIQVQSRQLPVIEHILSKSHERNILIATHGRAMRILLATLLDESLDQMDKYPHNNLCLYKLEYYPDRNQFEVLLTNDITHLLTLHVSG
ncbi:histidine phosphatase family protein [Ravibacter arvi]|uniref:Histidine phosphatase family protein n=1 Tax=Ravibacter arvi TaxID=2051041 RepID=A0ABP8LWL9_9BACT